MRLTLDDIKRHNELLDRVFAYFQEQMRDITDIDERQHLRPLTICLPHWKQHG